MANELDELTGPILKAGNSNSKIINFFGPSEIAKVSKSFGTFGSAAIGRSNQIVIVVPANNNEPVTAQEVAINKPLVKMINALASIDGFIKQRLDNQKIIEQNRILSDRESQVEQQPQEVQVIQQDAEKVGGSSAGLLALGGLALLTLDPVQEALKSVFDGVASIGRFVTNIASSINGAFEFLLSGSSAGTQDADAAAEEPTAPKEGGVGVTPAAEPVQGTPPEPSPAEPSATPAAQEQPSFLGSVSSGALTGAGLGMLGGKKGALVGGIVGGAIGAYNYATGSTSSAASIPVSTTSTPASGGSTTPVSPSSTSSNPSTDATQSTEASGAVIQVNHPDTGSGWGIAGATDAQGRPIAFSKEAAEAFAKMMQASGGAVKPSDVASSKRSVAKNEEVGGVTNSPHLRGVAMDIHGTSEQWIRQHGHKFGWKPHDYAGTHGGHFVFGGPGMTPDEGSFTGGGRIAGALSNIAGAGLEAAAKLFGALGSAVIKPGVPRTDLGAIISQAAKETNAEIATAKTPTPPTPPPAPTPPRINNTEGGPTQNPPTMADRSGVYYYLRRFGYQDLSTPESALMKPGVLA